MVTSEMPMLLSVNSSDTYTVSKNVPLYFYDNFIKSTEVHNSFTAGKSVKSI